MEKKVVIVGIGELGGVFARGFLRMGFTVIPVVRSMDITDVASSIQTPELVLLAVAEKDIDQSLKTLPENWRDRAGLLQNELLPAQWQKYHIKNPTVISVWFEKKKGMDTKVLLSTVVYGPQADLIEGALKTLEIPSKILATEQDLLRELVVKNVFVYAINIAGLMVGGTTGQLWENHQPYATDIAKEIIKLQSGLANSTFSETELIDRYYDALKSDPGHKCMGRAAQQRLKRAVEQSRELNIELPQIETIYQQIMAAL